MPRRQDKNIASIGKYFCHCTHPSPGTLQCKDFLSWVSPSTLSLTDFTVPSFCRLVQLPIESIYISEIQTLLGQGVPNLVQVPILVWKRFRSVCPKPATLSLSFSCHVYATRQPLFTFSVKFMMHTSNISPNTHVSRLNSFHPRRPLPAQAMQTAVTLHNHCCRRCVEL